MNAKIITISLTLIIVVLGTLLSGCTTQPIPDNNPLIPENISINNPALGIVSDNVVDANNQFAIDLYSKFKLKEGNVFFSPYSISSALAMTYEGAKGQTAQEMRAVLHLPNDTEKIHSGFVSINNQINKADSSYKLSVANALWAQNNYPFLNDYFTVVDKFYGGKTTNLDFKTQTEKSRVTINTWVENKTNDKIKDLIAKGVLTPNTRLVLTNAIYFKANWSHKFNAESTKNGQFKLDSGTDISVKMMHQTNQFNYGETSDIQILEMNYIGNDLSMLIILPKNDMNQLETSFSLDELDAWKKDMTDERVQITLPRFKFETEYLMSKDLKALGMPTAFNPDLADFTGMYDNSKTDENLYISEVVHKTFIEVAENGTEAAAATGVLMEGANGMLEEPKIFTADHSFIFIIQQKDSGNILFMGRISDPR